MIVTTHAIDRYIERIDPCATRDAAREEIRSHERAVAAAASIGCQSIRLGDGSRLVLEGEKVVSVFARDMRPRQTRQHAGRPPIREEFATE